MLSSFDIFLIISAIIILAYGIIRRHKIWKLGCGEEVVKNQGIKRLKEVIKYALGHKRILEDSLKGTAHLFIFWGFLLPLVIIVIAQFKPVMPIAVSRGISLILDLIGALAIIGIIILIRSKLRENKLRDGLFSINLWILLAIFITGFLAEGARLNIENIVAGPAYIYTPVGFIFSFITPESPLFLKLIIRAHFVLVLFFIAGIPFTNMKHMITGILNIYYQKHEPKGTLKAISLRGDYFGAGKVQELTWKDLLDADACVDCGRCERSCPAFMSSQPLSPRGFIKQIGLQSEKLYSQKDKGADSQNKLLNEDGLIGEENIWNCTTCLACVQSCPVLVEHTDKIISIRRHAVLTEGKKYPQEYKQLFKNIEIFGDSLGKGGMLREDWAANLKIKKMSQDSNADVLFWVGCIGSLYDERSKNTTISAAKILEKAGVNFRILGSEERCCGDPARRVGNEYTFQKIAKDNIETFKRYGINKVVTFCPHCFNVFKNEYSQFGSDFEAVHFTQFIMALIKEGKLNIKTKIDNQYTYHDPCYLARYNDLTQTPRDILDCVLEEKIKEMEFSQKSTFCCGAGGGNFWRGKVSGKRMEGVRIDEAINTKADGIITACPFCKIMFDSAVEQRGLSYSFKVMDIIEMIDDAT
jgi:Fe-S oxidoreductase/nitrate reductase gamma subunit